MDNSKTIALMKATLLSAVYPIGAIYMSTNSTNPGQIFGGTWESFAQGRTIIGAGMSDQEFVPGTIGGESKHLLTENEMPSHTHEQEEHNHTANSQSFRYWFSQFAHKDDNPEGDYPNSIFKNADNNNVHCKQIGNIPQVQGIGGGSNWGYRKTEVSWESTPTLLKNKAINKKTGGDTPHSILPPYIVTYIWRRIA